MPCAWGLFFQWELFSSEPWGLWSPHQSPWGPATKVLSVDTSLPLDVCGWVNQIQVPQVGLRAHNPREWNEKCLGEGTQWSGCCPVVLSQ